MYSGKGISDVATATDSGVSNDFAKTEGRIILTERKTNGKRNGMERLSMLVEGCRN